ncbi:MAG: hypothetical protein BroJett018_40560 [Chloroflexota bacterium]|nr:hypothetical protein [Chloroflexota bacterium]NOG64739.1 hypothetical protein [Chloroflexota bacterium]GIK66262.1 MAG: hypothetical protein BroJett018_40560 [Chloroflexota bacterium]
MQVKKLRWVGLFAIAMAYLESAVVVYLRRMYDLGDDLTKIPNFDRTITGIEIGREVATMVMLLTLGWIAGRRLQSRVAFAFFTFGVWDIFYYVWLWVFIGWPASPLTWDILFLVPVPWWGPVISPVLIASLMVAGGIVAIWVDDREWQIHPSKADWAMLFAGMGLALIAFMWDALGNLPLSPDEFDSIKPSSFPWGIYLPGLLLMVVAVWRVTWVSPRQKVKIQA